MGKRIAIVEAEKNQVEIELSELQHKYSALKQQHDRTIVSNERKMPIQEHMDTVAEYKRLVSLILSIKVVSCLAQICITSFINLRFLLIP